MARYGETIDHSFIHSFIISPQTPIVLFSAVFIRCIMFRISRIVLKSAGASVPSKRAFHASLAARSASSGKKSTTSRDTRIAGRLRFYKEVGVEEVEAPWMSMGKNKKKDEDMVASPISAGVDGTDSASGVHHRPSSSSSSEDDSKKLQYMLSPRAPGACASTESSSSSSSSLENDSTSSTRWFGLTLDGRGVSTPMGQKLVVPSETLAYMIAAEWNAQEKKLQPVNMPLMTLACTALDQASYHPDVYREEILRFLPTDTTCFWADPTEDRILHRRQHDAWKDLHGFVEERLGHAPAFATGAHEAMFMSRKRGDEKPFVGLPHPPQLLTQANDWTHSLDAWHLIAFSSMCSQSKSFLVAWGIMESHFQDKSPLRDLDKAIEASRVEEEFQIANWGLVEGGHDYDRLNCSIQLRSAHLFCKTIAMDNGLKAE